jgi:hypothetical protein
VCVCVCFLNKFVDRHIFSRRAHTPIEFNQTMHFVLYDDDDDNDIIIIIVLINSCFSTMEGR